MKGALRSILLEWLSHPEGAQKLKWLNELKTNKGWQAYREIVAYLRIKLRETPYTKQFVKLPDEQKLSLLNTYQYMDEVIDFILDPLSLVEQDLKVRAHNRMRNTPAEGDYNKTPQSKT